MSLSATELHISDSNCKGSIFWASLEKTHDPESSCWSSVQRLGIGPRRKSDSVSGRQDLVGKVLRLTWWWQVWNLLAWMDSSCHTLGIGCCCPKYYKIIFNVFFFFSKQINFKKDKGSVFKKLERNPGEHTVHVRCLSHSEMQSSKRHLWFLLYRGNGKYTSLCLKQLSTTMKDRSFFLITSAIYKYSAFFFFQYSVFIYFLVCYLETLQLIFSYKQWRENKWNLMTYK